LDTTCPALSDIVEPQGTSQADPQDGSESDVEIDEQDHAIFQEFGHRVDFLGSLNESSFTGADQPAKNTSKEASSLDEYAL
jgi:hypothetical protein